MGIRETLNEKPKVAGGAVAAVILLTAVVLYFSLHNNMNDIVAKMYYSDDDGKTYFSDDSTKLYPFDHNGKPAYRAYVYQGNGAPFVAFLGRYTDDAKNQLEALKGKENDPTSATLIAKIQSSSIQVKRPGETTWVSQMSAEGTKVAAVPSPDGTLVHQVVP